MFSDLYKIMVNNVTFVGFMGAIASIDPLLDPFLGPLAHQVSMCEQARRVSLCQTR